MGTTSLTHEVARLIEDICNDRVHGATFLAREALRALALAAEALPQRKGQVPRSAALQEVDQRLANARPAMASIKNVVARFLREMESREEGFDPHTLERELLEEMEAASREAARKAADLVDEGARVLTCSYSSAVLRTFKEALAQGRKFSVAAMESLAGQMAYGRVLLEDLSALGIPAALVPDEAISEAGVWHGAPVHADMALVGADKLLRGGGIVNGWPTLRVAEWARGIIPFYVVCETYKLDSDPSTEDGFDLVPGHLITAVFADTRPAWYPSGL